MTAPMPLRFALCRGCKLAWTAPAIDPCSWCAEVPIDCSPWGSDRRTWLSTRLDTDPAAGPVRAHAVTEAARYRDRLEHKRILARGIVARGNTTARLQARTA